MDVITGGVVVVGVFGVVGLVVSPAPVTGCSGFGFGFGFGVVGCSGFVCSGLGLWISWSFSYRSNINIIIFIGIWITWSGLRFCYFILTVTTSIGIES